MRLALIFDKRRDDTVGIYFERACRRLGIAADHFWMRDAQRIPAGYALYLRIDHGDYALDLPAHLRPRVFYATDTHLPKPWKRIRATARGYDLVCCAQRLGAEALPNGAWVPLACDPDVHQRVEEPALWDLGCVGTDGGVPRKFYLQALRERYPNSRLGLAPHAEMGAVYGRSRLGFNYSIRDDVNMRIFEILSCGTLLLTNRLRHDDLERLGLRDREHLALYRTPRELFELIDYYLAQEAPRRAIAARGMAHVHQGHTYVHRLEQILREASERLGVRLTSEAVSGTMPNQTDAEPLRGA